MSDPSEGTSSTICRYVGCGREETKRGGGGREIWWMSKENGRGGSEDERREKGGRKGKWEERSRGKGKEREGIRRGKRERRGGEERKEGRGGEKGGEGRRERRGGEERKEGRGGEESREEGTWQRSRMSKGNTMREKGGGGGVQWKVEREDLHIATMPTCTSFLCSVS